MQTFMDRLLLTYAAVILPSQTHGMFLEVPWWLFQSFPVTHKVGNVVIFVLLGSAGQFNFRKKFSHSGN